MADHDSGYKLLFSHRRMVKELLQGFIREEWVSFLDFSSLQKVGSTFVSDDLRERHSDMVWRLRWRQGKKQGWFYLYLLLEFQSTPDPFMAVRLLGYLTLLLSDLIQSEDVTPATGLPPVLSLVLYNGRRPWNVPLDLGSLFRGVPPGAEHLLPQLSYLLVAENQLRPEELALPDNRVASIFGLETCDPRDLPRLTAELAALLPPGREERLRHAVTQWLLRLLRRLLPGVTIPETAKLEDMAMLEENILEWWKDAREEGRLEGETKGREKGRKEGRQEGRKEGEARGQVKGMRQMLLRALEERFGSLPEKARRKVGALASAREMEGLLGRALVAKSLQELGLG